jgi:hypothetical protein
MSELGYAADGIQKATDVVKKIFATSNTSKLQQIIEGKG